MKGISRRSFLRGSALAVASISASTALTGCMQTPADLVLSQASFEHGVASGDPLATAVILWTRALPITPASTKSLSLTWELSSDNNFNNILRSGVVTTSALMDYTIKVDAQDLQPATVYYYRFNAANTSSPVGRTKTLPVGRVDQIKLAIYSCANYPAGYFNAYQHGAENTEFDAVLHLGDYIYEYAMGGYATDKAVEIGRALAADNDTELYTLTDYRKRYALYRTDNGLQNLHASAPFIVVWDDHEVSNDTWKEGAQNHTANEGDFFERRVAAVRAYYEWLPIRPPYGRQSPQIYRSFDFGDLISLHMLDTRIIGRDKQLEYSDYRNTQTKEFDQARFNADISAPSRTIVGQAQFDWLASAMKKSEAKWQVLGQQVLMSKMFMPAAVFGSARTKVASTVSMLANLQEKSDKKSPLSEKESSLINTKMPYNMDAWDGYPVEREKLYDLVTSMNKNLVVVAGDTHNAWHSRLADQKGKLVGVEFATPGVTSPGMESYLKIDAEGAKQMANELVTLVDDLAYCNLHQRGYMTLTINRQEAVADWVFIDNILSTDYEVSDRHQARFSAV
ncbi:MAG: alkaline phosphatase D [Alteromonadaceae bacterium]|jgi:alkaline phosphatase D